MENSKGIRRQRIMVVVTLAAFFAGEIGGLWSGHHDERSYGNKRVAEVQQHNSEIRHQLIPTNQGLGRLVLNDQNDTFEFHVTPEGGQPEVCEGNYKVNDNGHAQAVGQLACTTQRPVPKTDN